METRYIYGSSVTRPHFDHDRSKFWWIDNTDRAYQECMFKEVYKNKTIHIDLPRGYVDIPYSAFYIRPKGMREKAFDAWRRKIIKLAAQNGGWKIIDNDDDIQVNY